MSESSARPEVSVVIPVYNEEAILRDSVHGLVRGLDAAGLSFELWLAENGSRDRTREIAAELAALDPRVKWFSCPSPNYGAALRMAIEQAAGEFVLCEEIDLCDLDFHRRAGAAARGAADLVVGSKAMPGAHDRRPLGRRAATRAYNGLLRVTLGYRGTDTHGLKAFRRAVLLPVVARCIVGHDVFASELVIRAQRDGVPVTEIPVELEEKRAPSIHLARRVPRVLKNLARLMAAIHLGRGAKER
ncbi:glycosyltransferase family 2 protein [Nannocystis pusilla]|uniref:glycosyltransferase family 2 protein n=1 Tax=Nannocystis pusilla TaxID=889268 RepID=UPI003B7F90A4